MKIQKESNFAKESVKFTVEITVKEAKEYAKALRIAYTQSLDLVPDKVLLDIIIYELNKYYAKK